MAAVNAETHDMLDAGIRGDLRSMTRLDLVEMLMDTPALIRTPPIKLDVCASKNFRGVALGRVKVSLGIGGVDERSLQ